jgi:hypothetical protein
MPAIPWISDNFLSASGLMYYGSSARLGEQYWQAAAYVDRIVKGVKPGDLPVQLTTSFTFGINLKTANALDITVPFRCSAVPTSWSNGTVPFMSPFGVDEKVARDYRRIMIPSP